MGTEPDENDEDIGSIGSVAHMVERQEISHGWGDSIKGC